jgi:DNA-directed RNA polymerase specialized sigma24 family protein
MGEGARVRSSLERLPSQQRQVIELIYFRGMSISDVSLRLGISATATTAQGVAAMRNLRDDLVRAERVGHPSRQAHE